MCSQLTAQKKSLVSIPLPSRTIRVVNDETVPTNKRSCGCRLLLLSVVVPESSVQGVSRSPTVVGFLGHVFKLATISKRTSSMVEKLEANLGLWLDVSFDPLSSDLSDLRIALRDGRTNCLTLRSSLVPGGGSPAFLGQVDNSHQLRTLLRSFTRDSRSWGVGPVTATRGTSLVAVVGGYLTVLTLARLASGLGVPSRVTRAANRVATNITPAIFIMCLVVTYKSFMRCTIFL